jgi:hypothetical protein
VARNGHVEAVATCPLLGEERKSLPTFEMTAFDPTRTSGGTAFFHFGAFFLSPLGKWTL